jgi:hypothetical protein
MIDTDDERVLAAERKRFKQWAEDIRALFDRELQADGARDRHPDAALKEREKRSADG